MGHGAVAATKRRRGSRPHVSGGAQGVAAPQPERAATAESPGPAAGTVRYDHESYHSPANGTPERDCGLGLEGHPAELTIRAQFRIPHYHARCPATRILTRHEWTASAAVTVALDRQPGQIGAQRRLQNITERPDGPFQWKHPDRAQPEQRSVAESEFRIERISGGIGDQKKPSACVQHQDYHVVETPPPQPVTSRYDRTEEKGPISGLSLARS